MHIHILGICGTFMGGIAAIAKSSGITVTGCDANVYPPMSTQLADLGIALEAGFAPDQLDGVAKGADVFVVGNAISRGNPLLEAIMNRGLAYTSGPEWLAEAVLRDKWVLAVAGTHGKTTTSAMLTWILEDAGLNPGYLIGGVPAGLGVSARLTESPFFVIEADEYDTAFCDKRSKFVHYRPRTAILNNLEFDHADIFADLTAIETQFHHLVRTIPGDGRVIVNSDAPALDRVLVRGVWSELERFGVSNPADWQLRGNALCHQGVAFGEASDALYGQHNQLNALAAIAAARHVGVTPVIALQAMQSFPGVARRMQFRGEAAGVKVFDDFAHHPTAIKTTVAGLRAKLKAGERILAVLEPRSNTMKLGAMKAELPASLAEADAVFCLAAPTLDWDVAAALTPLGAKCHVGASVEGLVEAIVAEARAGDTVLVMSNGAFGGIHERLLQALAVKV